MVVIGTFPRSCWYDDVMQMERSMDGNEIQLPRSIHHSSRRVCMLFFMDHTVCLRVKSSSPIFVLGENNNYSPYIKRDRQTTCESGLISSFHDDSLLIPITKPNSMYRFAIITIKLSVSASVNHDGGMLSNAL